MEDIGLLLIMVDFLLIEMVKLSLTCSAISGLAKYQYFVIEIKSLLFLTNVITGLYLWTLVRTIEFLHIIREGSMIQSRELSTDE